MIAIKDEYIDTFRSSKLEGFRKKSVIFLQKYAEEYCKGKSNGELLSFIDDIIYLAKDSFITRRNNIKKLMLLIIKNPEQFTPPQNELLTDRSLDEDYRLQRLERFLNIRNGKILVSTNSNLKDFKNQ